ncbi:MAG TPA: periplasmic heavy metal sensor [Thermoanaerobaculia bacterium]|nr:periplasmic heavy metal sensor [Thermoanaerobaculia bacterium]
MKRVVAGLLFASLASVAIALPELPEGKWWKRPRIASAIALTPDQESRIDGIFSKARPLLIDLKADLERKQGDLQDSLEDANADRRAVAARVDAVEDARAELQKARILMILDVKQVLRPEQWERLMRMQQEFRRERRERFGRYLERRRSPGPRHR